MTVDLGPHEAHRSAHGNTGWLDSWEAQHERLAQAERRFQAERDRRYTELRQVDREALTLARWEIDRRLEDMNRSRRQIEAVQSNFVSRTEYELKHEKLSAEIGQLREDVNRGLQLVRDDLAQLRTVVAVGPADLPALRSRLDYSGGEQAQSGIASARFWTKVGALAGYAGLITLLATHGFS